MQTHEGLFKLEPGSKCPRHSGAGTWTPRRRGVAALEGPVAMGYAESRTVMLVRTLAGGRLSYILP